jgi:type IV pilus assembly protein PilN
MTRINLSPWRAELRRKRERRILQGGIAVSITVLLTLILCRHYLDAELTRQKQRNQYINEAGLALNRHIQSLQAVDAARKNLLGKIAAIRQLQQQRLQPAHLFEALARTAAEDIQLTQIIQNGQTLKISGIAVSNTSISRYIKRLEASPWLDTPLLDIIESAHENKTLPPRGKRFTLNVSLSDTPEGARSAP